MATEQKGEDDPHVASPLAVGWRGMIEEQYRKIKENAETYPYVWGSYIVVYGGFGLWTAYRWRKLRKTEDRVRVLQKRLRELVEAEESATSSTVTNKGPPCADKTPK
uniref:Transmembrane protein n=1 Tax=Davidia involucrata TaxID=16924 RepID=A0A5B7C1I6_DAVIN